jgi:hypothetical protein
MKKIGLFIIMAVLSLNTHSQVRFGLYGNVLGSWFSTSGKNIENTGFKTKIGYGLQFDNFFTENYAFTMGLNMHNTGSNLKLSDTFALNIDGTSDTILPGNSIHYYYQAIRIPIGLRFLTNEIGYSTFYAELGLAPEIMLKASADIPSLGIKKGNIIKETNLINVGYFIGGGLEYSLGGSTRIMCGLLYQNGLVNMTKFDETVNMHFFTLKTGVIF